MRNFVLGVLFFAALSLVSGARAIFKPVFKVDLDEENVVIIENMGLKADLIEFCEQFEKTVTENNVILVGEGRTSMLILNFFRLTNCFDFFKPTILFFYLGTIVDTLKSQDSSEHIAFQVDLTSTSPFSRHQLLQEIDQDLDLIQTRTESGIITVFDTLLLHTTIFFRKITLSFGVKKEFSDEFMDGLRILNVVQKRLQGIAGMVSMRTNNVAGYCDYKVMMRVLEEEYISYESIFFKNGWSVVSPDLIIETAQNFNTALFKEASRHAMRTIVRQARTSVFAILSEKYSFSSYFEEKARYHLPDYPETAKREYEDIREVLNEYVADVHYIMEETEVFFEEGSYFKTTKCIRMNLFTGCEWLIRRFMTMIPHHNKGNMVLGKAFLETSYLFGNVILRSLYVPNSNPINKIISGYFVDNVNLDIAWCHKTLQIFKIIEKNLIHVAQGDYPLAKGLFRVLDLATDLIHFTIGYADPNVRFSVFCTGWYYGLIEYQIFMHQKFEKMWKEDGKLDIAKVLDYSEEPLVQFINILVRLRLPASLNMDVAEYFHKQSQFIRLLPYKKLKLQIDVEYVNHVIRESKRLAAAAEISNTSTAPIKKSNKKVKKRKMKSSPKEKIGKKRSTNSGSSTETEIKNVHETSSTVSNESDVADEIKAEVANESDVGYEAKGEATNESAIGDEAEAEVNNQASFSEFSPSEASEGGEIQIAYSDDIFEQDIVDEDSSSEEIETKAKNIWFSEKPLSLFSQSHHSSAITVSTVSSTPTKAYVEPDYYSNLLLLASHPNSEDVDPRDVIMAYILIGQKVYEQYFSVILEKLSSELRIDLYSLFKTDFNNFEKEVIFLWTTESAEMNSLMQIVGIEDMTMFRKCCKYYRNRLSFAHPYIPRIKSSKTAILAPLLTILDQKVGYQNMRSGLGIYDIMEMRPISTANRDVDFFDVSFTNHLLALLVVYEANPVESHVYERNRLAHISCKPERLEAYISIIFRDHEDYDFLRTLE